VPSLASNHPYIISLLHGVGLPEDFFFNLSMESDWSLIIKLHALFEAVLASLILKRLGKPELEELIANLDFNNVKSGKVAFARSLCLIDKKEVAFLRGLSELRNRLVHNISNVSFEVETYVSTHTASEKKKFKTEFGQAICALPNGIQEYESMLISTPRDIVIMAGYLCLMELQYQMTMSQRNLIVEVLLRRQSEKNGN